MLKPPIQHHATRHLHPGIINWSLDEVHVEAASNIAEISKEMVSEIIYQCNSFCISKGVERFVHVSSLVADAESESEWAASKGRGEAAVKAHYPHASIVRPSWMFGPEDRFLCLYANAATILPALPYFDGGDAKYQPVYVHDVARAIKNIVLDPSTANKTFDLVGPDVYTQKEIVDYVLAEVRVHVQHRL